MIIYGHSITVIKCNKYMETPGTHGALHFGSSIVDSNSPGRGESGLCRLKPRLESSEFSC